LATGQILPLNDKVEPGKCTREAQTSTEPETLDGDDFGWSEYRALFMKETLVDFDRYQRLQVMKLFCPLIVEDGLPMVLHPTRVKELGYDHRYSLMQLTRDLIGTERHEMLLFFLKFERALHIGKLDGSRPTDWEAWEALGRGVLWGLPQDLYKYMRMDYDSPSSLMDMEDSLYDTFRGLLLNGAAIYREEMRREVRPGYDDPELEGYTAILKYSHAGRDRPSVPSFETVGGLRPRRQPLAIENQLMKPLPQPQERHELSEPLTDAVDQKFSSCRIVLQDEAEPPPHDQDRQCEVETRATAGSAATVRRSRTARPRSEAVRADRPASFGSPARGEPARTLGYPVKVVGDPRPSSGTVSGSAMTYPSGASTLLGPVNRNPPRVVQYREEPPHQGRTSFAGQDARGSSSNSCTAKYSLTGTDALTMGTDWESVQTFVQDCYMPKVGSIILSPCVGPGQSRLADGDPSDIGVTRVPRFLPLDGGSVMGFFNVKQTHSLVTFLTDKAVKGQKIEMFGYTFDHPEISESLIRAALRGVVVRLTLNADEVEGRSQTRHAVPTITDMMRRCEEAGCGPSSVRNRMLEIWKNEGQPCAPVYDSWNRSHQFDASKRGPLHAKVFVTGPAHRVPAEMDTRVVVMGSTNWTVSSECNVELSVALQIGSEGAAAVDHVVRDLRGGATLVTYASMLNSSMSQANSGTRSRGYGMASFRRS